MSLRLELTAVTGSRGWAFLGLLRRVRARLAPPGSFRSKLALRGLRTLSPLLPRALRNLVSGGRGPAQAPAGAQFNMAVLELPVPPALGPHGKAVDIVLYAHCNLATVKRCLESLVRYTRPPFSLVIVDDATEGACRDYLASFAALHATTLIRHDEARGRVASYGQGLRRSRAACILFLDAHTVATPDWLDRLCVCAESDPRIGAVGPLPRALAPPPPGTSGSEAVSGPPDPTTVVELARLVTRFSPRLYPRVPCLDFSCLLVKHDVLAGAGSLPEDEADAKAAERSFGARVRDMGRELAIADDVFLYKAPGPCQGTDAWTSPVGAAGATRAKTLPWDDERVLRGTWARNRILVERKRIIDQGQSRWEGRRVLCVLPSRPAGDACLRLHHEARGILDMGVDFRFFSLRPPRESIETFLPGIPVVHVENLEELSSIAPKYDAVVATEPASLASIRSYAPACPASLYLLCHDVGSYGTAPAPALCLAASASLRRAARENLDIEAAVVGPSVDIDLFRPRRRRLAGDGRLRLAARARQGDVAGSDTPLQAVLRALRESYGGGLEIILLGYPSASAGTGSHAPIPGVVWAPIRTPGQLAAFWNEVDIFADFDDPLGQNALGAMASGVAVALAGEGLDGVAVHESNALLVEAASEESWIEALGRLVSDPDLRGDLQLRALEDVCRHPPERASFRFLDALSLPPQS